MNESVIILLQAKYPTKTLTVIDVRTATIRESTINNSSKDIALCETVVRARKPRSQNTVDLSEFDEELAMFLCAREKTVYYMPTGYNRYCHYKTNVIATGSVPEDVARMVQFGLDQSAQMHGEMRLGETRMFCLQNEQMVGSHTCNCTELHTCNCNPYPVVHVTVEREAHNFHIAAEVASDTGQNYHTMLSFQVRAEDFQESLSIRAGNIAYYLN